MKACTIIGGVDGVGKSSFLGILKECGDELGAVMDLDKILRSIAWMLC